MRGILVILCCFFWLGMSAQVKDNPNRSTKIPAVKVEKEVDLENKEQDLKIEEEELERLALPIKKYTDSFDLMQSESKGFTMIQNSGLVNPGVIYEERWRKKKPVEEVGMQYEKEQFFGEHKISSKYLKILYRDFQVQDGDLIRIFSNEDVIAPNVFLTNSFQGYKLELADGFNKIDFLALNQGDSGPNTAEFMIIDDKDRVIYSNAWNLATGGIATIIFIKE